MFENAKWIKYWKENPESLMLRKEFELDKKIKKAVLYIIGLGQGIYTVNGKAVTDEVLTTQFTAFDKRILYNKYDVTELLKQGNNCIGAVLGNGNYNIYEANTWHFDTATWKDDVKLIGELSIEYENGETDRIVTDTSWKAYTGGPLIYNMVRGGEIYDARREIEGWNLAGFYDYEWSNARIARAPGGILQENVYPNPKIIREIEPVSVNDKNVYDFGENISGWCKLRVTGECGARIHLYYGERLNDDGTLNAEGINSLNRFQKLRHEEIYILKGIGKEENHPVFNYHGFRYVYLKVEGEIQNIELTAQVVHTDIKAIGSFSCSDEMLNKIHEASVRSTLTNFLSVPTDCPHREQNGWTGDAYFSAQQALMNFDMKLFYEKWLADIRDSQRASGQISAIVPSPNYWGYYSCGGPVWDSALSLIPLQTYEYTGDKKLLEQSFEAIKKNIAYFETMTDDYLYSEGIGDWCPPGRNPAWPPVVTDTAYFYANVKAMEKICGILDKDGSYYTELAEKIKTAYRKNFVSENTIGMGGQLDYAVCIYCGLLNADEERKAAEKLKKLVIENDYHIDCGVTGIKAIFTALAKYGYDEVLYKMVTNPTYPSYAYWINNGATTLCETWNMDSSLNHPMFSEVDHWFYKYIAGINLSPDGLVIEPHFVGLEWVKAKHGEIAVEYDKNKINVKSPVDFILKLNGQAYSLEKGEHTLNM